MILIVGGTSGIGLETAKYLKDKGKNILICGRNKPNEDLEYKYLDVTKEENIKELFSNLSNLKGLIYSTGITTKKKSIEKFDTKIWENIININVTGALLVLKYSYKNLVKNKGKIVIINSVSTHSYSEFSGVEYTMSKNALSGMVKQLSQEFIKDGVIINSIFPSMTQTPMLTKNVEKNILDRITNQIPIKRLAQPLEIAKAIEFLLSEDNSYMTGCGLEINGGQYLNG